MVLYHIMQIPRTNQEECQTLKQLKFGFLDTDCSSQFCNNLQTTTIFYNILEKVKDEFSTLARLMISINSPIKMAIGAFLSTIKQLSYCADKLDVQKKKKSPICSRHSRFQQITLSNAKSHLAIV